MAKAFGKRPNDWLSLLSTKEFLDELTITEKFLNVEYQAVITKKGGSNLEEQGTWIYYKNKKGCIQYTPPLFFY